MSHTFLASNSASPSVPPQAKESLRILYADDVPELRNLLQSLFERDGHRIECHSDGQAALKRMNDDLDFDLVITDHHMPRMNGLEFVTQLRDLPFAGKIMVFSSELSSHVAEKYQQLGVDRILYKPVYPSALRHVMAEMFGLALRRPTAHPFASEVGSIPALPSVAT